MPAACSALTIVLNSLTLPDARVARFGREEADRVVAPVVAQALLDQVAVVDERVHRHQLDRGDAEPLQVVDHRRGRQPGVGAAQRWRHVGVQHREAAHVQLVDHRVVPRHRRAPVVAPSEGWIDHRALAACRARCRAGRSDRSSRLCPTRVAEERVAPAQRADDALGVGIEQQLVRVEAVAFVAAGRARTRDSRRAARARLGQVAVPDLVGVLAQRDALHSRRPLASKRHSSTRLGVLREQREVDAFAVPRGAARIRTPGPDAPLITGMPDVLDAGSARAGYSGGSRSSCAIVSLTRAQPALDRAPLARSRPPSPKASARPKYDAAERGSGKCAARSPPRPSWSSAISTTKTMIAYARDAAEQLAHRRMPRLRQ